MRPLDPRLLHHARASRGFLALSLVLGVAMAGLTVAQASLLAQGITAVFLDGWNLGRLTPTLVALALVVAARAAVAWCQESAAVRAAAAVKTQLRQRLVSHVAALGPTWAAQQRTGEIVTLATRGLDALDAYFARYLPQLVLAGAVPAVVLARIAPADLSATVTIAATLPLIPLFMALIGWQTQATNRRQFRHLARLSHHFLDVVGGLPTLKAFGRAAAQVDTIRTASTAYRRLTMRTLRVAFLSALVLELLATLSVALVAVGIGVRLVSGHLDLATALLVLILAPEAYQPLRQVGANYHASAEGLAAAGDVFAVLDAPVPATGRHAPPTGTELRLIDVTVRYPDRPAPALSHLTLTVRPGEVVALTGTSGCGKSTVLATLLGFVRPQSGQVTVNGTPVNDLDPTAWRRRVAWLPQRPWLFAGTVADNIRLGNSAAPLARVREAAHLAAAEFIDALPDGFDTVLADGGTGLSAGQRQRIALARTFLHEAPVVLLDEPTAHLDPPTEAMVLDGIRRFAHGRTVLIAAHRPALIAFADRCMDLETQEAAAISEHLCERIGDAA